VEFLLEISLSEKTCSLLGMASPAYISIAGMEVVGVSQAEMQRGSIEKYVGAYERFTRAIILGLRGTLAIDFLKERDGLAVRLLLGCIHEGTGQMQWSPNTQLERLRLQVNKGVQLNPISPADHLDAIASLSSAISIEPAIEEVGHGALSASAVLPLELSPSGVGTLAQVLDELQAPCCVRFLIAPIVRPRPDTATLIDQVANADRLCLDPEIPRAIAYRARAIRFALQRMMNTFLGQACAIQIQVRSSDPKHVAGVVQLLRDEIARPKTSEILSLKGQSIQYTLIDNRDETPIISALPPTTTIPIEHVSPVPAPSFWMDGSGEKPKHIAPIETAAILPIPPLPEYCDLKAISSVVVEAKGAIRPEKWSGGGIPIGTDSLGNDISFDDEALARHVHLIGIPGSGKTTLMFQMVNSDLAANRGFVIFDPHGDLGQRVAFVAGWVPGEIASNLAFPGLRLLSSFSDGESAIERDVGAILEAVESALPKEFTGPVFRQIARACLTLHAYVGDGSLISDSVKYAQDEKAWETARTQYEGPNWVIDFFVNHHLLGEREKAERVDWFASKFTDYLRTSAATTLFAPVGQGLTAIEIVNSKAQLVIDFAALGTSTFDAGLLGQLFITSFLRNLTAAGPNPNRRFLVYLDEVQLFYGPAVERALQEGRKYGLSVVAAHQTSSQLSQQRFDSLVGQVGLELVFRCSMRDSQLLADHLGLSIDSISSLADLSCWVAGGIALQRGGSFSLTTTWKPRSGLEIGKTYLPTMHAHFDAGRYSEARAMITALLRHDPQNAEAQALLRAVDEIETPIKAARAEAEQAAKRRTRDLAAAREYLKARRYSEAREVVKALLARDAGDADAQNLARAVDEAETRAKRFERPFDREWSLNNTRELFNARKHLGTQNYKEARKIVDKLLAHDPENSAAQKLARQIDELEARDLVLVRSQLVSQIASRARNLVDS
jgi:tetratricopeptide (TPR) repeat protein